VTADEPLTAIVPSPTKMALGGWGPRIPNHTRHSPAATPLNFADVCSVLAKHVDRSVKDINTAKIGIFSLFNESFSFQ
jgi:hypothetical protein